MEGQHVEALLEAANRSKAQQIHAEHRSSSGLSDRQQ
jgi:hypothetical protein